MSHPARSIPSRRETEARTSEEFPKAARGRSPHPPPPYPSMVGSLLEGSTEISQPHLLSPHLKVWPQSNVLRNGRYLE